MHASEANWISIETYLDQLGIRPGKLKAGYCLYLSPYPEERTLSFIEKTSSKTSGWILETAMKVVHWLILYSKWIRITIFPLQSGRYPLWAGLHFSFISRIFPSWILPKRNPPKSPSLKPNRRATTTFFFHSPSRIWKSEYPQEGFRRPRFFKPNDIQISQYTNIYLLTIIFIHIYPYLDINAVTESHF